MKIFFLNIRYVVRLEPTISTLIVIGAFQRANRDSDGYKIRKKHHSEINTFHNVCKSKISFTELYEFIRHIHECQFNFVYLYEIYQTGYLIGCLGPIPWVDLGDGASPK